MPIYEWFIEGFETPAVGIQSLDQLKDFMQARRQQIGPVVGDDEAADRHAGGAGSRDWSE